MHYTKLHSCSYAAAIVYMIHAGWWIHVTFSGCWWTVYLASNSNVPNGYILFSYVNVQIHSALIHSENKGVCRDV